MTPGCAELSAGAPSALGRASRALLPLGLGVGAFLRLADLGEYGFWTDELFHVFAARSFLEDGSFHVPWDPREYRRALPVTLLTALSFGLFGESEASARVFFALTNLVFIALAYALVRPLFGRPVALLTALASCLSIQSIQMSQECRMYTLFQLVYFVMSVAFLRALELERGVAARARALALALAAGLLALSLQRLVVVFAPVVFVYAIAVGIVVGIRQGAAAALRTPYAAVVLPVSAAGLVLWVVEPRALTWLEQVAFYVPTWERTGESNFAFYRRVLADSHPVLLALYPLGAAVILRRHGRLGLYFVLSFALPFLLHAFFFSRKAERYIFHLLPFFVIVSAVGAHFVWTAILEWVSGRESPSRHATRRVGYALLVAGVVLLVSWRLFRTVLDTSIPKFSSWKDLDTGLLARVAAAPSITTDRLRFNYYFGRYPTYVIDASDLERVGGDRVLVDLGDFERALDRHPSALVVTYDEHFRNDTFVGPGIRGFVSRELQRIDDEADARIMVFARPASRPESN